MKVLLVLATILVVSRAEFCYNNVVTACGPHAGKNAELSDCNATFSGAVNVFSDLQAYANSQISHSYEYLLMATHFGNYQKNRLGFEKLYRSLSDKAWSNGIELIKFITKRGGQMNFGNRREDKVAAARLDKSHELSELGSLARALDSQKVLAEEAHRIHGEITRRNAAYHDPEVGHYLEEEFLGQQVSTIRKLSGHTNDLKKLLKEGLDSSLALFMFDEYLQK